jgi:hypothetical protein
MKSSLFVHAARQMALALIVGASASAFATPVAEMLAEDLLAMAPEAKKALNLNSNQQTLWQQVENKSRAILRERVSRRERLQLALRQALDVPKAELRDLAGRVEAEEAASASEDKALRELWLEMNDALDENQRQIVVNLLFEQLMRVPDSGAPRAQPHGRDEGGMRGRGMGRGRGGMPGAAGGQ